MVGGHSGLRPDEPHTVNAREPVAVAGLNPRPPRDLFVHMAKVAQAHRGAELVHLGITADVLDILRAGDAKVLPLVEQRIERGVAEANRSALDGVEHLSRVEAEHRGVTEGRGRLLSLPHAKGMRGVIDQLEAVRVGDAPDRIHVAEVTVHVDRDDRRGPRGHQAPHTLGVDGVVVGLDVGEDGNKAGARNGVHGAREGERRGDHLAAPGKVKGLQGALKRKVSVAEECDPVDAEIGPEALLELSVLLPHIRKPVALPERGNFINIFRHWRHRRARDENPVRHIEPFHSMTLARWETEQSLIDVNQWRREEKNPFALRSR